MRAGGSTSSSLGTSACTGATGADTMEPTSTGIENDSSSGAGCSSAPVVSGSTGASISVSSPSGSSPAGTTASGGIGVPLMTGGANRAELRSDAPSGAGGFDERGRSSLGSTIGGGFDDRDRSSGARSLSSRMTASASDDGVSCSGRSGARGAVARSAAMRAAVPVHPSRTSADPKASDAPRSGQPGPRARRGARSASTALAMTSSPVCVQTAWIAPREARSERTSSSRRSTAAMTSPPRSIARGALPSASAFTIERAGSGVDAEEQRRRRPGRASPARSPIVRAPVVTLRAARATRHGARELRGSASRRDRCPRREWSSRSRRR